MKEFTVIQYNCGNANQGAVRPFFDAASQAKHQVLAIQEPGHNKHTKSTYCPKGYVLSYEALLTTKVCFMVSRDIDVAHWRCRQYGPYIASLWIELDGLEITIINAYNPRGNGPRIQIWQDLVRSIQEANGEILLL